jgi:hypothetical protein
MRHSLPSSKPFRNNWTRHIQTGYEYCTFDVPLGETILSENRRTLSFEAKAGQKKGFFSARHKAIATLFGRLRSLPLAPNDVVAFLVAQRLNIAIPALNLSSGPHLLDKRRTLLQPPSRSGSSTALSKP